MKKKKKLEVTEGCTAWSYTINGKEFIDLSLEEQQDLIKELVGRTSDPAVLQEFFTDFVQTYGAHENLGTCSCCGDTIDTWKYEY